MAEKRILKIENFPPENTSLNLILFLILEHELFTITSSVHGDNLVTESNLWKELK